MDLLLDYISAGFARPSKFVLETIISMETYVKPGQNVLIVWKNTVSEEIMKKKMEEIKTKSGTGVVQLENDQRLSLGRLPKFFLVS